jgi:hypothetical protein
MACLRAIGMLANMLRRITESLKNTWWFAAFNGALALLISVMTAQGGFTVVAILGFFLNVAGFMLGYSLIFTLVDGIISAVRKKLKPESNFGGFALRVKGYFSWLGIFVLVGFVPLWLIGMLTS